MPVYEQSYRSHEARGPLQQVRFWPILREGLRLLLARRALLILGMLAWLPLVARVIQVYVVTRFPEAERVLPVDGRLFGEFLNQQLGFVLLLLIFSGAGLIAEDLRTGAIIVYLSRPLTRRDYVLGKLGILLGVGLAVTLVPGALLYLAAVGLAPDSFLEVRLVWIAPAMLLHSLAMCLVFGLLMLALSALSRSARVAGLGFAALVLGLELVKVIVQANFDLPAVELLSLQNDVRLIGEALFGIAERPGLLGWPGASAVLLATAAASLLVIRSRVRAVEVV
jgi:ABC-2 type transport system permease protein